MTARVLQWLAVAAFIGLLFAGGYVSCVGCRVDEDQAREVLRESGYDNVTILDEPVLGQCETPFRSRFVGTINGRGVEGVVCCGWLRACSVRF